ncbi:MAG: hypothetical protein AB7F19_04950 [Candidatus Babeliales bacterium]
MTYKKTLFLCVMCLLSAILLFAYMKEWLIIRLPQVHTHIINESHITKQQVSLWYWRQNRWHHEKTELLSSHSVSDNISQLVSALLVLFEEEKLVDKKVTLQSVTLSSDGMTAFISLDRSPMSKQASVYIKLMMIESILKTLRENGIKIQKVQFLTHHQPMQDMHLDFSNSWVISGFLA